jgi:thiosulfate/3-mercaptopyruvate sulfurtransferase
MQISASPGLDPLPDSSDFTNPVVAPDWLQTQLNNPNVVIVDCRFSLQNPNLGRQQYRLGHIPGAYYLDLNQDLSGPVQKHGGRHPLPDSQVLAATLSKIGIHSHPPDGPTHVVVYDDSRFAFAARLWWLLTYLDHTLVSVLDGGFTAWQSAGLPVTQAVPVPKSAKFVPCPHLDWIVDVDRIKTLKDSPEVCLIDSRESIRYRGEHEPIDPIAGHIPGAVNYPWQDSVDEQGYVRPVIDHQQRWANIRDPRAAIVYCGSGVTACVNLLSMAIAGLPMGKLYPGSWSDWCSNEEGTSASVIN